jgi:hypothetical protein
LGAAAVPVVENAARLGRLPTRGLALVALPMKIDGGTGRSGVGAAARLGRLRLHADRHVGFDLSGTASVTVE